MKYPLAALLMVREHKEGLAQQAVMKAERALVEAKEILKKTEEECKAYEEWCHQEINQSYNDVIGKDIFFKDLDSLKVKGIILLEKVEEKYKDIEKRQEDVELCIRDKEQAIADLAEAKKQTMKLSKHKEKWEAEEKKRLEAQEELELEDFPTPKKEHIEYSDEFID